MVAYCCEETGLKFSQAEGNVENLLVNLVNVVQKHQTVMLTKSMINLSQFFKIVLKFSRDNILPAPQGKLFLLPSLLPILWYVTAGEINFMDQSIRTLNTCV